jgi:hypothetical protein
VRKSVVAALLSGLFMGSIIQPFLFDIEGWHAFAAFPYKIKTTVKSLLRNKPKLAVSAPKLSQVIPKKYQSYKAKPVIFAEGVDFREEPFISPELKTEPKTEPKTLPEEIIPDYSFANSTSESKVTSVAYAASAFIEQKNIIVEKRFHLNSSTNWAPAASSAFLPSSTSLGASQVGVEMTYQLNKSQAHPFVASLSSFTGLDPIGKLDSDTTQLSAGLRYKPFQNINATVGVNRLIGIGSKSRNDWALTLAADKGLNYDPPLDKSYWLHWHAATNASLIGLNARDLFASGEARIGVGFPLIHNWQLTPYLGTQGILQYDRLVQSRLEAGPGLWLRGRLGTSDRLDFRLSYMKQIAGTVQDNSGIRVQFGFSY